MKPTQRIAAVALCAVLSLGTSLGTANADEAWQKAAGVGAYAPKTQDWDAIEAAARKEGTVVIYSVSSRIAKLVDGFKDRYGIKIVGYDIASDLQLEKLRREHKAGVYSVDVLFNSEMPLLLNEALPDKLVWNFVPDDVADKLDESEKQPFLIQRHSSRIVYYNATLNPKGAPMNSLWDLTRPEWKGRVLLPSPLEDGLIANFMQTVLQHPDEMAAAYQREFGKPITYSDAVLAAVKKNPTFDKPTASIEWLYRFLHNAPVFQGSTTKIFKNIGDVKQTNPPIGITTFSKLRKNKKGVYDAQPAYDLDPAFGVTYPTALTIADMAPHPNAAKLLIRYMMDKGFKPWNVPGDYAARSDVEAEQIKDFHLPPFGSLKLWPIDPEKIYESKFGFLALYLALS